MNNANCASPKGVFPPDALKAYPDETAVVQIRCWANAITSGNVLVVSRISIVTFTADASWIFSALFTNLEAGSFNNDPCSRADNDYGQWLMGLFGSKRPPPCLGYLF